MLYSHLYMKRKVNTTDENKISTTKWEKQKNSISTVIGYTNLTRIKTKTKRLKMSTVKRKHKMQYVKMKRKECIIV